MGSQFTEKNARLTASTPTFASNSVITVKSTVIYHTTAPNPTQHVANAVLATEPASAPTQLPHVRTANFPIHRGPMSVTSEP